MRTTHPHPASDHPGLASQPHLSHTCYSLPNPELTNATFPLRQGHTLTWLSASPTSPSLASPTLNLPGQLAQGWAVAHFLGKATPTEVFEVPVPLRALALGGLQPGGDLAEGGSG